MTGAFLSIMRPNRCWTILHVSILVGLLLTLNAQSASFTTSIKYQSSNTAGNDSDCNIEMRVRRYTVYNVSVGQRVRINCTVIFCNDSPPTVTWIKVGKTDEPVNVSGDSHIKTQWIPLKDSEGIFYLIFQNILRSDSGQYQCRGGGNIGHAITVNVYDRSEMITVTQNNVRAVSTTSAPDNTENLLLYVYSAAGITTFVIIVIIISVISMRGCKGKPEKDSHAENQYMEIPMVERPLPQGSLEPSQRGSPSAPPSRRSTKRKTPPRQPNELRLSRDNEQAYSPSHVDRQRQRNTVEEESGSVVYAALNHELPQRAQRPRVEVEETSEYAAIRLG